MDRAAQMTAFVNTVESGGFSAAARKLGLTASALSKLVTRLEDRLGIRLLHRTTRRLHLTPEGEDFYARARAILTAIDEAEAVLTEAAARPRGLLRLHCGSGFGMHQLVPAIPRFLVLHPEVELNLTLGDQPLALLEESFDLAIRSGALEESTTVARRIRNLEQVICAAPSYLAQRGTLRTPDDLQQHNCLWLSGQPGLRRWPFDTDEGIRVVHVAGNIVANNAETLLQMALAGVGIARLTDDIVGASIRCGALLPLLADWHHVEPVPLFATYPSSHNLSPKVRAMVDFLVAEFADAPWHR